ncbi:MAG TPA: RNA polymerase sigma-70 factor [Phnomibacter sp.]|nr:RNA polymerase sigma-70 factor [Phnomibacter sp.]
MLAIATNAQIAHWQHRICECDDHEAYEYLFKALAPPLVHFANAIVHERAAAEDVVNDVFLRVWEKRKTLDQIENLRFYLYTATRNFAINHLKSSARQSYLPLQQMESWHAQLVASQNPAGITEARDVFARLQAAIEALPPRCRIILKLTREDGLKQREVAELLHISPKTVENQLAIALHKLASAVPQYQLK